MEDSLITQILFMTQTCKQCGKELPLTIEFYSRYPSRKNTVEHGKLWHSVCKQCEYENKRSEHWKNGLLKCTVCGEYFPEEIFHKIGSNDLKYCYRNGRDNRCPACKAKQIRTNLLKLSSEDKLYKTIKFRFLGARDRAKAKGLNFNVSEDYIRELWKKQKGLCAISQIPMTYDLGEGRVFTNLSIDRINPNEGYIEGNLQLVCMAINQMKSDMSLEELYMFSEAIIKNKNK